jgi:hypothetical protein
MSKNAMLFELVKYVLPEETVAHFSVVKIEEELYKASVILHIYLEEENTIPEEYRGIELSPNGFYPASTIKDFPLRDKKVVLHICRRRRRDSFGKSYSRHWDLTAEGTRYSKEFEAVSKGQSLIS